MKSTTKSLDSALSRRQLLTASSLLLGLHGLAGAQEMSAMEKIKARGVLKVAVYKENAPYSDGANSDMGGVDVSLAKALAARQIAAAGLDVFEGEPSVHPDLLTVPNVVLTPHIASASIPTRLAMANLAADNLISYFTQGKSITPLNTVAA